MSKIIDALEQEQMTKDVPEFSPAALRNLYLHDDRVTR